MLEHAWALRLESLPRSYTGDKWHGPEERKQDANDGLAIVHARGTLLRGRTFFWFSETTSLDDLAAQFNAIRNDNRINRVLLLLDSPGGTVAGTNAAAIALKDLAAVKPVFTYVENMMCSGAMWLASHSTKILAEETSIIGSIGCYVTIIDSSKFAEDSGLKVHVVRAGEHKGTGAFGTEVTDEHLEEAQQLIDRIAGKFVDVVAAGRDMALEQAESLATGQVWIADEAKELGLVDGLCTVRECIEELNTHRPPSKDEQLFEKHHRGTNFIAMRDDFNALVGDQLALGGSSKREAVMKEYPKFGALYCEMESLIQ